MGERVKLRSDERTRTEVPRNKDGKRRLVVQLLTPVARILEINDIHGVSLAIVDGARARFIRESRAFEITIRLRVPGTAAERLLWR